MEPTSIFCRYQLTREEYIDIQVYMRWRYLRWRGGAFGAMLFMFIAGTVAHGDNPLHEALSKWNAGDLPGALNLIFPLLLILGVYTFAFTRIAPIRSLCSTARLRKEPELLNQKRLIVITESGIHATIGDHVSEQLWGIYSCARECETALVLHYVGQNYTLWLPKHGFSSSAEVDHCRARFKDHIKDFRS